MTAVERQTIVPWVVLWSAQRDAIADTWTAGWTSQGIRYPGGHVAWGFHWKFYDSRLRGQGRPIFSELDTQRQIAAMRGPRCQVCGTKLPGTNTPWLLTDLDARQAVEHQGGKLRTPTAPTCVACWPVAEAACPHLVGAPPRRVIVPSHRVWGVSGKLYRGPLPEHEQLGHFEVGHRLSPWVLAAQLVVELEGVDPA